MTYASQALLFLISTAFGFLCLIVLLRFWLQVSRADFYNPLVKGLVKLTDPFIRPARRVIPGFWRLDIASLVVLLALKLVELALIGLTGGLALMLRFPTIELQFLPLIGLAIADLLFLTANVALVMIIGTVIMSWINPDPHHPASRLLYQCSAPLLRPFRRRMPDFGGLDLSPMLVSILLILFKILIVQPLWDVSAVGLMGRPFAPTSLINQGNWQ